MAKTPSSLVSGIGGFFFRARDPQAVEAWYFDNLGVTLRPRAYEDEPWRQDAGETVFTPFAQDTDYFGDMSRSWMINFRVHDLDALVEHLRANGNTVEIDPETYPNGRFARTHDPEGNPVELWQPA